MKLFLWEYSDVFSNIPGKVIGYQCTLQLKPHEPFFTKPYGIPISKRVAVEEELQKMEVCEIIERSISPYNNPLVIVNKSNGQARLVLDSRQLNKCLYREIDHPENIDELLYKFKNIQIMSSLDLTSGFHQMPLAISSRKFTAFLYNGRCYQYCVVPFGLNSSVAEFIRALDYVLGQEVVSELTIYVDDILVSNQSWEDHLKLLKKVCEKLRRGGMTLKLEKCKFGVSELKFLGHVITKEGISADPEKIKSIVNFSSPRNRKQLKSFYRICGFYRKYINGQCLNVTCLSNLIRKNATWNWSEECQKALEEIKNELCKNNL